MVGELALKELEALGPALMVVGGFIELYLPLHYAFRGAYHAIPELNLILALLSFVGCGIVWMGRRIAGGLTGIIIGSWIMGAGEFFEYRVLAGELVLIGGIASIIAGLMKIHQQKLRIKEQQQNS